MDVVETNTICVVPLAGDKPSVDRNIRRPPSPPEDEKRLIMKDRSDESQELINTMKLGIKWVDSQQTQTHPLYKYLKENNTKAEGWIRKILPKNIAISEKDLSSDAKSIYINQFALFSGFPMTHGPLKDWQKYLYHAWGISKWTSNHTLVRYYERGFHHGRLPRADKGFTLMNSPKKRKSVMTPFYVFKREQTQRRYRNFTHKLDNDELKIEFEGQDVVKKESYHNISCAIQLQAESLHHDIISALENTHGNVSYKALSNHIGGIATPNTIASHLKSLDGYSVVKSRMLPQLNERSMKQRVRFCESFFIFWLSAKCLSPEVKLIKTHMDEKWVYAMVTRTNIKLLSSYHINGRHNYIPHKTKIDQIMFIVVNGFILIGNGMLEKG